MKILSYNINGIRSFKNWKFILEKNPDIIGFQELKYDNLEELEKYKLKNYYCFFNPDKKKGHGGVAIFTKINPEEIYFDKNGRLIILEFKNIFIINIYAVHAGET